MVIPPLNKDKAGISLPETVKAGGYCVSSGDRWVLPVPSAGDEAPGVCRRDSLLSLCPRSSRGRNGSLPAFLLLG